MKKKKQVEDFFKLFIMDYLVEDILILDGIKKNENSGLGACTIPQAMAVLSGIDLLGLLFGKNKNTNATDAHIIEFYRITKNAYKNQYSDENIEKLVLYRHGMMHNFFPKLKGYSIGICKSESQDLFVKESFDGIEIDSLNVSILTRDFLVAVLILEKMINEGLEESFYDNILISLKDLGYSNELAKTTTKKTTVNIVTRNKRN